MNWKLALKIASFSLSVGTVIFNYVKKEQLTKIKKEAEKKAFQEWYEELKQEAAQ